MDDFMKNYLILFNNFLNELERTQNTKLIFHAQMLYDNLEDHLKEKQ